MTNSSKILIVKILIVLLGVCLIGSFVIPIVLYYAGIVTMEMSEKLMLILFLSSVSVFAAYIVLLIVFKIPDEALGDVLGKERYELPCENMHELFNTLENALQTHGYDAVGCESLDADGQITHYKKRKSRGGLDCLAIVRVPELTNHYLDKINIWMSKNMRSGDVNCWTLRTVYTIFVVCADRMSDTLGDSIGITPGYISTYYYYTVGITLEDRTIHLYYQKDGPGYVQCKRMRKEFLSLMNLQEPSKQETENN